MKKAILIFIGILFFTSAYSQNLSAFSDYRNYFYVFDNGNLPALMESLPVKFYQVGGNAVLYADNSDNLKVYYKGNKIDVADFTPAAYVATDNYIVYFNNRILYVFDNGKNQRMPGWVTNYVVGDSIVGFLDENTNQYKVYTNGETIPLPDALDNNSMTSFVAGDNILCYANAQSEQKAFYHNKVYDLGTNHVSKCLAGTSTIGFQDDYSQTFKVFYDGTVATMENQMPKSFQVGDQLIAYIDAQSNFKIFYKGDLITVFNYEPDFYSAVDNVVVFGTENFGFNVFYKGKVYKLESTTPTNFQKDFNSVAYIDQYGYLKMFSDGEIKQVSQIKITDYILNKNVLMYKMNLNDYHFFLNGKDY